MLFLVLLALCAIAALRWQLKRSKINNQVLKWQHLVDQLYKDLLSEYVLIPECADHAAAYLGISRGLNGIQNNVIATEENAKVRSRVLTYISATRTKAQQTQFK